jgi:hypothetical protein
MPPLQRPPGPRPGALFAVFCALPALAPAWARGEPGATPPAAASGRAAPAPLAAASGHAAAPGAPGAAPKAAAKPEPGASSRSTLPRLGRFNAYGSVVRLASGEGTVVLAPVGVELGLASVGREEIAIFVEGAPAFGCDRCRGSRVRLGAALRFHLAPRSRLDPWVGLAAGGQLFALPSQAGTSAPLLGFYNTLQLGVDLAPSAGLRVGPFVTGSLQAHGRPIDKKGIDPSWPMLDASPLELGAGLRVGALF